MSGTQLHGAEPSDLPALWERPRQSGAERLRQRRSTELADGRKIPTPEATVRFETHTVKLSASYDELSVAGTAELPGRDRAGEEGPGSRGGLREPDRRHLLRRRRGGRRPGRASLSLVVAEDARTAAAPTNSPSEREDGMPDDDDRCFRVAERVLPAVPGGPPADLTG
ncbi:DUF6215 domain-containing protein [Streptomyces thinghirensis]|nr:DUF6215 domain-containing protein [Streptomyces thinghirensis]